jgi:hypothetical protein
MIFNWDTFYKNYKKLISVFLAICQTDLHLATRPHVWPERTSETNPRDSISWRPHEMLHLTIKMPRELIQENAYRH